MHTLKSKPANLSPLIEESAILKELNIYSGETTYASGVPHLFQRRIEGEQNAIRPLNFTPALKLDELALLVGAANDASVTLQIYALAMSWLLDAGHELMFLCRVGAETQ